MKIGGNLEQRAYDLLTRLGPTTLCQACDATPFDCDSVRAAFNALRRRGTAHAARAGRAFFYFLVPGASRPEDRRGKR